MCQNGWKVAAMADVKLLQHSVAPGDVLFVTLPALQVLRRQRVVAIQGDDLSNFLVEPA